MEQKDNDHLSEFLPQVDIPILSKFIVVLSRSDEYRRIKIWSPIISKCVPWWSIEWKDWPQGQSLEDPPYQKELRKGGKESD